MARAQAHSNKAVILIWNNQVHKNAKASNWLFSKPTYDYLILLKNLVFDKCQFKYSDPFVEKESTEYGACILEINSLQARFRVAKITPTKVGQFVTLWKRIENGPIQPYDIDDAIDLFIILVSKDDCLGQFIFPKSILYKHGILSHNNIGGKRAIRIYPPWDLTESKRAKNTQIWQLDYFLDISKNKPIDYNRAKLLYGEISKNKS